MPPPANLADSFPDNFKQNHSEEILKVGSVIKTHVGDIENPKVKRFIVVGISFDKVTLATVYINSEINKNVYPTAEMQALNHELKADTRPYLDHDSFVDCNKLYEKPIADIKTAIAANPKCHLSHIDNTDYLAIKAVIQRNKSISKSKLRTYGMSF